MAGTDVYRKTEAGVAEMGQRKLKLNPRLRTMLILVDGTQPEFILQEEGAKIGAPPDALAQLAALGLVERSHSAASRPGGPAAAAVATDPFLKFREAKNFMNTTIVDAMGLKSFLFTLKLEKCSTVDDLRDLADAYRAAIAKSDEARAAVLSARLQDMLR